MRQALHLSDSETNWYEPNINDMARAGETHLLHHCAICFDKANVLNKQTNFVRSLTGCNSMDRPVSPPEEVHL